MTRVFVSNARSAGRIHATTLLLLAMIAIVVAAVLYPRSRVDAPPAKALTSQAHVPAEGVVEAPAADPMLGTPVRITGWALHASGIAAVEARVGDRRFAGRIGLPRPDVASAKTGFPDRERAGFAIDIDVGVDAIPIGGDRVVAEIIAMDRAGGETLIGTRSLVSPAAAQRWKRFAGSREAFHLLPALSGVVLGAAAGLDGHYASYVSPTTRVGTRIPILYMRTTKGRAGDYAFDPDWDVERRCRPGADARRLSDDSLNGVIRYAIEKKVPILFTLNGGIWGDAACDMPEWDLNDLLEQDKANCQWSEKDEVVADDHLKNLAGAFDSPELARALTLNVYAADVRRYKKRNLQQAAARIAEFAKQHPSLFVGVTLEPDLYMNPFFGEQAWFDYNPATLRQFREWLAGTGPYAGQRSDGAPDLSAYRRRDPLTLRDVNRLSGRSYTRWDEVEPPRVFSREPGAEFWSDPWMREWEHFRRHLVDLHYDELSQWAHEAGIPANRIWSAQGFMAPHPSAMPFALTVRSPVKNYDSGGMSVEGSKPSAGEIGAILYGASAQNAIRMEGDRSLFATFASLSPAWAVVEYNSADLRRPKDLPTYADAYRGLREMWNHGARFVSPMAWPGSSGRNAGKPGYDPFTAWRDTPLEEAAKDFLLARMHLPLGSKLWTFGAPAHADSDGWTAEQGRFEPRPGYLQLEPDAEGRVTLVSPVEANLDPARAWRIVALATSTPRSLRVAGRGSPTEPWTSLGLQQDATDIVVRPRSPVGQLRIEVVFEPGAVVSLTDIAAIPER